MRELSLGLRQAGRSEEADALAEQAAHL